MKKNRLGRTDLRVSRIVLGGGWVGGLFIDPDLNVMEKALLKSINSGINWIDTIFRICVYILVDLADIIGISYEAINIWIFVIIQPLLIIIFFILWRKEKNKNK